MTTITLKIDKRTKAGKAFMAMSESFFKNVEGIQIVEIKSTKEESPYNADFVAEILERSKNLNKEKLTHLNPDDVWGSIL